MGVMRAIGAGAVAAGLLLAGCGAAAPAATGAKVTGKVVSPPAATASASPQFRGRRPGSGAAGGFRGGGFLNLSAAASYLGISGTQLQQDLRSGKSLAEVAKSQGKTVQGLEQAMVAAAKSQLAHAVSAGRMTASAEQQQLASLQQRIAQFVNRTLPATASATGSGG